MLLETICKSDILVDTNVLSHSANPASTSQSSALAVLLWVQDSGVSWILDDQGKAEPSFDSSRLFKEYYETVGQGNFGLSLLIRLAQLGRVGFVKRPPRKEQLILQRLVPRNVADRAILGAAAMSKDRALVSNDLDDFNHQVRRDASGALGVTVCTSDEAVA